MPKRKSFLLRIDPTVYDALHKWADDELRSVNGQLDFLVRKALRDSGRLKPGQPAPDDDGEPDDG